MVGNALFNQILHDCLVIHALSVWVQITPFLLTTTPSSFTFKIINGFSNVPSAHIASKHVILSDLNPVPFTTNGWSICNVYCSRMTTIKINSHLVHGNSVLRWNAMFITNHILCPTPLWPWVKMQLIELWRQLKKELQQDLWDRGNRKVMFKDHN